jgi:hypothetical protein
MRLIVACGAAQFHSSFTLAARLKTVCAGRKPYPQKARARNQIGAALLFEDSK